jgi:hypothetical protein
VGQHQAVLLPQVWQAEIHLPVGDANQVAKVEMRMFSKVRMIFINIKLSIKIYLH